MKIYISMGFYCGANSYSPLLYFFPLAFTASLVELIISVVAYEQIIKAKDEQIALLKAMLRQYVKDL